MTEKEYTPPPVTGYRKLTQSEVDLVNKVKAAEAAFAEVWRLVKNTEGVDQCMVAEARTCIQDGTMWLSRAVFRPESPFDEPPAIDFDSLAREPRSFA